MPNAAVAFTFGDQAVGVTHADAAGRFEGQVRLGTLPVGRYLVDGTCGETTFRSPVDLVVTTSSSGRNASQAAAAGAVLSFFVLLAGILTQGRGDVTAAGQSASSKD